MVQVRPESDPGSGKEKVMTDAARLLIMGRVGKRTPGWANFGWKQENERMKGSREIGSTERNLGRWDWKVAGGPRRRKGRRKEKRRKEK